MEFMSLIGEFYCRCNDEAPNREVSELPNQEWVLRLSVGGITFLKNDWAWLILDVPRPHGDSSMVVIVYIYCMDMYGSTYKQIIAEKEEAG